MKTLDERLADAQSWLDHYGNDDEQVNAIAEARAILSKLPKCADGATVTPGIKLYKYSRGLERVAEFVGELEGRMHDNICNLPASEGYSTREAAEAAKGAK